MPNEVINVQQLPKETVAKFVSNAAEMEVNSYTLKETAKNIREEIAAKKQQANIHLSHLSNLLKRQTECHDNTQVYSSNYNANTLRKSFGTFLLYIFAFGLTLLLMLCMVACREPSVAPNDRDKLQGTDSSTQSNFQNETIHSNRDAPDIDANSLDDYLSDVWSNYKCSVSEPVVEDDRALYTIDVSYNGRFANITGSYEMVLVRDVKDNWNIVEDFCRWIELNYALNKNELFSEEYYWAIYPLTPVKSDPIYFELSDISDNKCTLEWWAPEHTKSKINNAYNGKIATSIYIEDKIGLRMPHWVFDDIEISSVKNSNNPIHFTFKLTPDDFMIVPSDESAKYVGTQKITLSRIVNDQYYNDLVVDALKNDAHREMINWGESELWHNPELVWRTSASVESYIWIDSICYAGSLYLTKSGTQNNSLYILYGMKITVDCPGTYAPKHGVMYYAINFSNVKSNKGVLTYDKSDIKPFNDSATESIRWIKGGNINLAMTGSTSLTSALEYYQVVFGKVYSIEYIEPTSDEKEYINQLERDASGKIGLTLNESLKVVRVIEGSSAETAGIKVGDVLVAINECPVGNLKIAAITKIIQGTAGTEIELTFLRNGSQHTYTVVRESAE